MYDVIEGEALRKAYDEAIVPGGYPMNVPRITLAMLRGACKEQRDIFKAEWPEGADATIENVRRAQELGLNLAWGEHWFPADPWKAYNEAIAQARVAYNEAIATAWVAAYIQSVAEREAQPSIPKAWRCNECGAFAYTENVSADDVHDLGCMECGCSEWTLTSKPS